MSKIIVDPFTGEPVAASATAQQAQSATGLAGQAAIGDPNSLAFRMLGHFPTATAVTGWNIHRGVNTVMGGNFNRGQRFGALGNRPGVMGSVVNTLSPTRFTSFSSARSLMAEPNGASYTPFNFLGSWGNKGAERLAKRAVSSTDTKFAGKALGGLLGFSDAQKADLQKSLAPYASGEQRVFDGGVLARLGVSSRLGSMANKDKMGRRDVKRLAKTMHSMNQMGLPIGDIQGARSVLDRAGKGASVRSVANEMQDKMSPKMLRNAARAAQGGMLSSFNGRFTQRIAGFQAGMSNATGMLGKAGQEVFDESFFRSRTQMRLGVKEHFPDMKVSDALSKGAAGKGKMAVQSAFKKGGMGLAARLGGSAALTLASGPFAGFVGTALTVHALASMGLELAKSGAELGKDAAKSFQGQIQKPIMGMGYRDNAINATSRARGLTAIQESRLNARNALGHEAGMLARHFG